MNMFFSLVGSFGNSSLVADVLVLVGIEYYIIVNGLTGISIPSGIY